MKRQFPFVGLLVIALAAAGCGSPSLITARNLADATSAPQSAALPTAVPANGTAPVQPTSSEMPGMVLPTNPPPPTSAGSSSAQDTPFVLIYQLYGTPTSTVAAPTITGSAGTPASGNTTSGSPTTVPTVQPTQPQAPTAAPTTAVQAATPSVAAPTSAQGGSTTTRAGDPANGKKLFNGKGTCFTCHDPNTTNVIVGPSLKGVATRAGTRKPGMSASDYLHESILNPNAYVVQGFTKDVMPKTFSQLLTPQDIEDLVAYLLTLK